MKTWFLNLSLSRKQMYALLAAGIIPTVIVALLSFIAEKNQIQKQAFNQLEAVRQIKASAVQRYFDTVGSQLVTLANSRGTVDAMSAMTRSFSSAMTSEEPGAEKLQQWRSDLGEYYRSQFASEFSKRNEGEVPDVTPMHTQLGDTAVFLQHAYIADNQNRLGQKHLLDSARGEASYHFNHYLNHSTFRKYLERFGFYDIFLIDAETGNIVYSVFKESDFATSLLTGPYKDTNFAAAFRKATKLKAGQIVVEDFEVYLPSYNSPASFMASPITQGEDTIGVLVFQIPLEPINQIMSERTGMGESGETYLIGENLLMRSDSILDAEQRSVEASFKRPDAGRVDTEAARLAVAGKSGNRIIKNYSGNTVLSSFAPIEINGVKWAVLAEIDVSEAFAPVYSLAYMVIALCAVVAVGLYFAALYISGLITNPILVLSNSIRQVQTSGDFQRRIDIRQDDEIGQTCHSFNQLLSNLSSAFSNINDVLDDLGDGRCDSVIDAVYSGDIGRLTAGVNRTAEQIQVAKRAQEKEAENARHSAEMAEKLAEKAQQQATDALIIKKALDVCDTSVMIADRNFNIVYLNNAVQEMMQGLESEIKKEVTNFDANNLLGSNIDSFHKRPSHQRQLLSGLTETYKTRLQIAEVELNLSASPILSDKGELLGTVIEWRDMTEALARQREERRIADENARISQALENSSTGTMIADNEHNIIYANKSMTTMMANAEKDLRKQYGEFDSRKIVGMNIDTFHTAPNHQRHILDQLSDTFSAEFNAGESTFNITANPIVGAEGERIGTVVEWVDRTAEVAIEKEIAGIIAAASKGDFSRRLDVSNKSGFFHRISQGLNQITGQTETALKDVIRVFSALSEGDLTQTIDSEFDGQFAQLKNDANKTILKLRDITSNIQQASTLIATAANQISAGNSDLSSRTETQASSLEETAASMEEITQTVLKSEENASKASALSTSSTDIAQQGYSAVEETAVAMTDISDASDRIASIIGVIDEIAFQTNLLALNAAVEAARAGEQGRGFAVVAGEVRNLAQRSSSAAKEIKDLINDSQVKVDNGIALVQNSKQTLNEIVEEIQGVNEMIIEISSSAREQSAGIEQVNSAVTQMDTITQQNAALVEEASAASAALAEQAQSLSGMISFFKQ